MSEHENGSFDQFDSENDENRHLENSYRPEHGVLGKASHAVVDVEKLKAEVASAKAAQTKACDAAAAMRVEVRALQDKLKKLLKSDVHNTHSEVHVGEVWSHCTLFDMQKCMEEVVSCVLAKKLCKSMKFLSVCRVMWLRA